MPLIARTFLFLSNSPAMPHRFFFFLFQMSIMVTMLQSRMFGKAPSEVYKTFATQNVTMNLHHDGIDPSQYTANSLLSSYYNLLSMNVDRKYPLLGFVLQETNFFLRKGANHLVPHSKENKCLFMEFSIILKETTLNGIFQNIFCTQKTLVMSFICSQWTKFVNKSFIVRAMQYLADFFVDELRKNNHQFATTQEEAKSLIYNWSPLYTGIMKLQDSYPEQQIYVFNNLTAAFEK